MTETSVVFIRTEQQCWDEIKDALDRIDKHVSDIDAEWVLIGNRLIEIKRDTGIRGGVFMAAVRRQGIDLNANQISAAQWWAGLAPDRRSILRREFPGDLAPASLQKYCGETHPEWSKRGDLPVSRLSGKQAKGRKRAQKPAPAEPDAEADNDDDAEIAPEQAPAAVVKLTQAAIAKIRNRLKEEEEQRQRQELREKKRAARQAAAEVDQRPTLTPPERPVIMYGVQLWPIPAGEPAIYDYDQLYFAIQFWRGTLDLLRPVYRDGDRNLGITLRERMKPMQLWADRRFTTEKLEATRFVLLVQRLADLFRENPDGEEQLPPLDLVMRRGW